MQDIAVTAAIADAAASASGDAGLVSTLGHALRLAGAAAILVAVAGVALGAVLALRRFPGRRSLGAVTARADRCATGRGSLLPCLRPPFRPWLRRWPCLRCPLWPP